MMEAPIGRPQSVIPPCPSCGQVRWLVDCQVSCRVGIKLDAPVQDDVLPAGIHVHAQEVLVDQANPDNALTDVAVWMCQGCGMTYETEGVGNYDVPEQGRPALEWAIQDWDVPWRVITDYREI